MTMWHYMAAFEVLSGVCNHLSQAPALKLAAMKKKTKREKRLISEKIMESC